MSEPYIIIEGGLVVNDPGIPTFDLDILDSQFLVEEDIQEIADLYWGLSEINATDYADRVYDWLINNEYGLCDSCAKAYHLASRQGRCGDCGDCGDCCTDETKEAE